MKVNSQTESTPSSSHQIDLIDTHAHLSDERSIALMESDSSLFQKTWDSDVRAIINISTDPSAWERSQPLKNTCRWGEEYVGKIFHAAALHPCYVSEGTDSFSPTVLTAAKEGKIIAIGETGLDYYYPNTDKNRQKEAFRRYIQLAQEHHLPLIIHCREAFEDFFSLVDEEYGRGSISPSSPGVVHCFTGSQQEAEKIIERDWYLSFSGILTFKNNHSLRKVAGTLPLERILLETDSPYLAPQSQRGKVNFPAHVLEVAEVLSEIHELSLEEIARITTENAKNLFKI